MSRAAVRADASRDSVAAWARTAPSRIAIVDVDGRAVTYAELDLEADRFATTVSGLGVEPGARVALWAANSAAYLWLYLGILRAGAVVVQINHRHTTLEARYQLETAAAEVLVFDDSVAERVAGLDLDLRHVIGIEDAASVPRALSLDVLLARSHGRVAHTSASADRTVVLGFTSGTTGHPKAAELTARSIRTLGDTNMVACRYVLGSVQVFGFSLSFTAGIPAHVLPHLRVGGTTVLLPTWDTERLVEEIHRYRATFTLIPSPPIGEFCEIAERRPEALASVVALLHSTARAPEAHLERLVGVVGPRLVEGWGMTENSGGLITATTAADYASRRERIFSSAGQPVPGAAVRAIGADGAELDRDGVSVGLLEVRTDSLARGYWGDPEATADAFRRGWFRTGDLGAIDRDGYVYLVDRRSDLIVSGGMNVYPSEVERVLAESPAVAQCAVVGAPHDRWGRTPVAFVVPADEESADAAAILAFARERLAAYKLPTRVHFVDGLPTNAGGKVLRRELAALVERDR